MPSHADREVVILGAGFAGLACAKRLARAPVNITIVDRRNHHLFQPLLYQVATAALSPADIAAPIRHIVAHQKNTRVILGEATGIDLARRELVLVDDRLRYDTLVVATGLESTYFGNDAWEAYAPGLKSIEDALEIRRRFLLAFETAEREPDEAARRGALTFVVVGGGPTGVELAGTMIEIARRSMPADFRAIDTRTARVVLIEAQDRLLGGFHPDLSARALKDLERLGVEVHLETYVTDIDAHGVTIGDDRIAARSVAWAAGMRATQIGEMLAGGENARRDGRVVVRPDLSLPDHPEVFIVGDAACVTVDGREVACMAPGATQMGRHVARLIMRGADADPGSAARVPFRFVDKGMMATIGRGKAVADVRGFRIGGFIAWLLWGLVHVYFLIGFRRRLMVLIQWAWAYVRFERGTRLITGVGRGKGT